MTCENEAVSRATTRTKAMQVDTNENTEVAKEGISSIREQLDKMSAIFKGSNVKVCPWCGVGLLRFLFLCAA